MVRVGLLMWLIWRGILFGEPRIHCSLLKIGVNLEKWMCFSQQEARSQVETPFGSSVDFTINITLLNCKRELRFPIFPSLVGGWKSVFHQRVFYPPFIIHVSPCWGPRGYFKRFSIHIPHRWGCHLEKLAMFLLIAHAQLIPIGFIPSTTMKSVLSL